MASVEPMLLGTPVARSTRFSWKVPAFLGLFVGVGCIVLWIGGYGREVAVTEDSMTMAGQPARAVLSRYGIGSSPVERVAIAAIEASSRGSCGRDVSMKATKAEIEKIKADDPFFEKLADLTKAVENKAVTLKASSGSAAAAVPFNVEDMPGAGVNGPWSFFDPMGLSTHVEQDTLLFYREAELKHGRICMLASLGIVVGESYHPLFGNMLDGPAFNAIAKTPVEYQYFWWVLLLFTSIPELANEKRLNLAEGRLNEGYTPGDIGWDPLKLKKGFVESGKWEELQAKELNNGRLAMIGAAGMLAQEMVNGKTIFPLFQ